MRFATLLLTTAWLSTGAAADPLTGDITKAQLEVITMTTIARFAGSDGRCPRFHVIERAVFQDRRDADIPGGMLETQEFKNAQAIALMDALERKTANPSDFCLAVWQLFGPQGLYKRQMLEAN